MTAFTPETPVGRDVQALLMDHLDGLTPAALLRLLRTQKSRMISETNLRVILGHSRMFTAISGDRYVLAGRESRAIKTKTHDELSQVDSAEGKSSSPLIANLPLALMDYVVFD